MNATRWRSLTEFAKFLGQEGLCRAEETEKGIHIAWIDNSPEALRRQAAVQKQQRMERNDEEWEQRLLRQQIQRAQAEGETRDDQGPEQNKQGQDLERKEGERVTFSFGAKQKTAKPPTPPQSDGRSSSEGAEKDDINDTNTKTQSPEARVTAEEPAKPAPVKMSFGSSTGATAKQKPRNMAALFGAKKGASQGSKRPADDGSSKKMSEAERVMRQDIERSKGGKFQGIGYDPKRVKFGLKDGLDPRA